MVFFALFFPFQQPCYQTFFLFCHNLSDGAFHADQKIPSAKKREAVSLRRAEAILSEEIVFPRVFLIKSTLVFVLVFYFTIKL